MATLTEEEWLTRFAARLMQRAEVAKETADQCAVASLPGYRDDFSEEPEEAADEELSYWER
jgi:hypothetical protein